MHIAIVNLIHAKNRQNNDLSKLPEHKKSDTPAIRLKKYQSQFPARKTQKNPLRSKLKSSAFWMHSPSLPPNLPPN